MTVTLYLSNYDAGEIVATFERTFKITAGPLMIAISKDRKYANIMGTWQTGITDALTSNTVTLSKTETHQTAGNADGDIFLPGEISLSGTLASAEIVESN